MNTIIEAKVFKNGGSNAIRIPAIVKLTSPVVYLEIDEDSGDIIIHKDKPQRFAKLLALHAKYGPISDEDWDVEFDREPAEWPVRPSLTQLDEHFK
jgi:virulence-associated protein VagC